MSLGRIPGQPFGRPPAPERSRQTYPPLHRKLVAQAVAAILAALVPLAYASPTDPTWIVGIYDNGDYDDVVLAVASADGAVALGPPLLVTPESSVGIGAAPKTTFATFCYSLTADRAPPVE